MAKVLPKQRKWNHEDQFKTINVTTKCSYVGEENGDIDYAFVLSTAQG